MLKIIGANYLIDKECHFVQRAHLITKDPPGQFECDFRGCRQSGESEMRIFH